MCLLDYVAAEVGCRLSDLRLQTPLWQIQHILRGIEATMFSLNDWNDAVNYLTGEEVSFENEEEAAAYLQSYRAGKRRKPGL